MPIHPSVPDDIADTIRESGLDHLLWVARDDESAAVDFGEGCRILARHDRFYVVPCGERYGLIAAGPGAQKRIARAFADHGKRLGEEGARLTADAELLASAAKMVRKPPSNQRDRILAAAEATGYPSTNALARGLGISGAWLRHALNRPIWPAGHPRGPKRGKVRTAATLESIATLLGVTPESIAPDESETP